MAGLGGGGPGKAGQGGWGPGRSSLGGLQEAGSRSGGEGMDGRGSQEALGWGVAEDSQEVLG